MGETDKEKTQEDLTLEELFALRGGALSPEVLSKLEEGLKCDFTVGEACVYAGLARPSYYVYWRQSSQFRQKMKRAKQFVFYAAKNNIADAVINRKDVQASQWLLERRRKKLYSPRSELTGEKGGVIKIISEVQEQ